MFSMVIDSLDAVVLQAFLIVKDTIEFVGNRTECALLMLLRTWGADYKTIRDSYSPMVEKVWDFDSAKKMAGVLIKTADGFRLYNKASIWASDVNPCHAFSGVGLLAYRVHTENGCNAYIATWA